jgi:hypothetical protein
LGIFKLFIFSLVVPVTVFALNSKNKVEELFIWKISDELKLSIPDEKKVSDLIRTLNQKKSKSSEDLQENLKRLAEAKVLKEKEKLLLEQKRLLRTYNDLSLEEADQIQKILGVEKAAQYFVLKNDLTNKLKSVLLSPDSSKASEKIEKAEKLAPPQIIEEK